MLMFLELLLQKNSPNRNNAIELIKYLTTDEAQKTYVNNTYEYSVNLILCQMKLSKLGVSFKKDLTGRKHA